MNFEDAIRGFALGDIFSQQNGEHRLFLIGDRRLRRYDALKTFSHENHITTHPEPYVHGYSSDILGLHPSDDTEWLSYSRTIASGDQDFSSAWKSLAESQQTIRARIGVKTALRNLQRGMQAPVTGHDNPHYFDNNAMFRALGIATAVDSQESLVRLVLEDAQHTHSEDGIWCALAIAICAHKIKEGFSIIESVNAALVYLPESSWSYREVNFALNLSRDISNAAERVFVLEENFVDRIYPFPYAAPETLGLLLAHLLHSDDPELLFSTSFLHRRNTDSLPALLGFFLGLTKGRTWMPKSFQSRKIRLDGVAIPHLSGQVIL